MTGMGHDKAIRRRELLAATLALTVPAPVLARESLMPPSIRPATPDDTPAIVALLMRDAQTRRSLDPLLWRLASDAPARIEAGVRAAFDRSHGPPADRWLVAQAADRIVGVAHAMLVPVPPIYGVKTGPPGLLLDDCYVARDAPPGTAEMLLAATEAALRSEGVGALIASCPAAGPWRPVYERHGYEPVTLYLVKHGFRVDAAPSGVRPARADDVPGIVRLSADHRHTLARLNPRFWPIHPDADSRFEGWMRYSLTLKDRDMFVAGAPGEGRGYVIAQPVSPLLVPAIHDIAGIGVIDDFFDGGFADVPALSNGGAEGGALLSAAEGAFARRGVETALVVCPAAWTSKVALLRRQGYRDAKVWMLKH